MEAAGARRRAGSTVTSSVSLSRPNIAADRGSSRPIRTVSQGARARRNTASSVTSSPTNMAAPTPVRRTSSSNASPLSGSPAATTLTTNLPPNRASAGSIPARTASMRASAACGSAAVR